MEDTWDIPSPPILQVVWITVSMFFFGKIVNNVPNSLIEIFNSNQVHDQYYLFDIQLKNINYSIVI